MRTARFSANTGKTGKLIHQVFQRLNILRHSVPPLSPDRGCRPAGHLGHFFLGVLIHGSSGAVDGGGNQILEHFNIVGVNGLRLDLDSGNFVLAIHGDSDHLTAGSAGVFLGA